MSGFDAPAFCGAIFDLALGVIAQVEPPAGAGGSGAAGTDVARPESGLRQMLPLLAIMSVVFYFLLIRPQRKLQRAHETLLRELKKNDNVRTSAGIFGKVVGIEPDQDQVVLEVDENRNVRMRVLRSSIVAVLDREKKDETPAASVAGKSR